ncbi:hypothetical protein CsSME_00016541 [Camellia sinensis var. sinensis]
MATELHITISLLSEKMQNLLVLAKGRFFYLSWIQKQLACCHQRTQTDFELPRSRSKEMAIRYRLVFFLMFTLQNTSPMFSS